MVGANTMNAISTLIWIMCIHSTASQPPDPFVIGQQLLNSLYPPSEQPAYVPGSVRPDQRNRYELASSSGLQQALEQPIEVPLVTSVQSRPPVNSDPATLIKYLIGNLGPSLTTPGFVNDEEPPRAISYGSAVEHDLEQRRKPTSRSSFASNQVSSERANGVPTRTNSVRRSLPPGMGFGDAVDHDLRVAKYARFKTPDDTPPAPPPPPPIPLNFDAARPIMNLLVDRLVSKWKCANARAQQSETVNFPDVVDKASSLFGLGRPPPNAGIPNLFGLQPVKAYKTYASPNVTSNHTDGFIPKGLFNFSSFSLTGKAGSPEAATATTLVASTPSTWPVTWTPVTQTSVITSTTDHNQLSAEQRAAANANFASSLSASAPFETDLLQNMSASKETLSRMPRDITSYIQQLYYSRHFPNFATLNSSSPVSTTTEQPSVPPLTPATWQRATIDQSGVLELLQQSLYTTPIPPAPVTRNASPAPSYTLANGLPSSMFSVRTAPPLPPWLSAFGASATVPVERPEVWTSLVQTTSPKSSSALPLTGDNSQNTILSPDQPRPRTSPRQTPKQLVSQSNALAAGPTFTRNNSNAQSVNTASALSQTATNSTATTTRWTNIVQKDKQQPLVTRYSPGTTSLPSNLLPADDAVDNIEQQTAEREWLQSVVVYTTPRTTVTQKATSQRAVMVATPAPGDDTDVYDLLANISQSQYAHLAPMDVNDLPEEFRHRLTKLFTRPDRPKSTSTPRAIPTDQQQLIDERNAMNLGSTGRVTVGHSLAVNTPTADSALQYAPSQFAPNTFTNNTVLIPPQSSSNLFLPYDTRSQVAFSDPRPSPVDAVSQNFVAQPPPWSSYASSPPPPPQQPQPTPNSQLNAPSGIPSSFGNAPWSPPHGIPFFATPYPPLQGITERWTASSSFLPGTGRLVDDSDQYRTDAPFRD